MLLIDQQTANELPTKIISFAGEAGEGRNEITALNRSELRESVVFFYTVIVV